MNSAIKKQKLSYYQKFTYSVVTYTELFFYNLGYKVGSRPKLTILLCWLVVVLSMVGFFRFRQEKSPMKLWVPPNSQFVKDTEWLLSTLEMGMRAQYVMFKADNVLTPEVLLQLLDIHEQVVNIRTEDNNIRLENICFKFPHINPDMLKFVDSENGTDVSVSLNAAFYCSFVESIKKECYERSLLELWDYDKTVIESLTQDDIIERINNHDEMLTLGHLKSFKKLLGGIETNENGKIISASTLQNIWNLNVNFSAVDMEKVGNSAGTADWASEEALEWEVQFETVIKNYTDNVNTNENLTIYYTSARSFGDITNKTLFQDIDKLIIGIFIMVLYVQFVISKFNVLEVRLYLGSFGLLSVGMSFIVGCGICSLIGIPYGPVHTSLPFLLMGLGVDDMFVIMACWDDLTLEQKQLPMPEVMGLMLKHGGVSITITSVTDILAFLIGSSTILPSLQSYCIYAAVCVLMIFFFAVTFFSACFVLDQTRIEENSNGILPCIQQEDDYEPNECSQKQLSNEMFRIVYDKFILTAPVKVLVVCLTVISLGFSIQSCLKLEQRFDPEWFIPQHTHLAEFLKVRKPYYPTQGFEGGLYMGRLNYTHELKNIKVMLDQLNDSQDIVHEIVDWVTPFRDYVKINFQIDVFEETLDDDHFSLFLSKFLFSVKNAKYQANFQFSKPLECGASTPPIIMSYIGFSFGYFSGPKEYLPAMHRIRNISENANFTTGDKFSTAWSKIFATWITDEVIDVEVLRNLQLALLCVMACTVILIADIQTCFWVFICVLLTMVNVCGVMQRWGLTIDLVSCIGLELAIGLCVDYATHIGHTFLTITGPRRERALKTMSSIGSAVLYGGISTVIGIFMLSQSEAYVFQSFFKIFLLVIFFGLFHGVVLMPVILSTIGPQPYQVHIDKQKPSVKELEMKDLAMNPLMK